MKESTVPMVQEGTVSEDIINLTNGNELGPNDSKVLDALSENNSVYTFSGIMRKIGMHQETLSRSLQRLSEQDLVQKSQNGYKLTKKVVLKKQGAKTHFTPILRAYLPSVVDVTKLIDGMAGRWFKNLRWIGMIENKDEHLLQWTDESGLFDINLRIVSNSIIIETNAKDDNQVTAALISASRIVEAVFNSILNFQLGPIVNFANNVLAN